MKIGLLTSSRADYSIYYPLIKKIVKDPFFDLEIIAFGTHISKNHGYTINEIIKDGFNVHHQIHTEVDNKGPHDIAQSIGKTIETFSRFWKKNSFDLIFALGDRYEIFAAVTASIPFNLKIAHLHGGETTLGAFDNIFRHSISHSSFIHFCSTEQFRLRLINLVDMNQHIYNVGALSIENLKNIEYYDKEKFDCIFKIDLKKKYILITLHPETVEFKKNEENTDILLSCLEKYTDKYQLIFTLPNADTMGDLIREKILNFSKKNKNSIAVNNFGTIGYLSCMKYCEFMMGNSSSGIVEASFFPKTVINIGDRQKGRIMTENIINCRFIHNEILNAIELAKIAKDYPPISVYGDGNTSTKIIKTLKNIY